MSKPIIGITANERPNPEDNFATISYAATGFVDIIKQVGGIPMILPISDEEMARHYVSIVDKVIITGGQNVDPRFYGEEKTIKSDDYHLGRDQFELAIIDEAMKQNKPIFTVCRGTQLLNVALGGTLHQEIQLHWQEQSAEHTTQIM
ncbi:MAG: gamma-glutamyl-gamma-aminobutyrate hydrolase family protein, partial [Candidatus Saccharibacteria bacterium]|nr:gamma-glutamyl-gamma-aminobutyrate hydrolase family protein [Candidatus Saccharibacteria bacterium]